MLLPQGGMQPMAMAVPMHQLLGCRDPMITAVLMILVLGTHECIRNL